MCVGSNGAVRRIGAETLNSNDPSGIPVHPAFGVNMQANRRSYFIDNANLIRLTDERGSQLLELGRQTTAMANSIIHRASMETDKEIEDDHVPDAGR